MEFEWEWCLRCARGMSLELLARGEQTEKKGERMKTPNDRFAGPTNTDLLTARRVTSKEHDDFRKALEKSRGRPFPSRMGRPLKGVNKCISIALRVKPAVLASFRAKAAKQGIKYQTLINRVLEEAA